MNEEIKAYARRQTTLGLLWLLTCGLTATALWIWTARAVQAGKWLQAALYSIPGGLLTVAFFALAVTLVQLRRALRELAEAEVELEMLKMDLTEEAQKAVDRHLKCHKKQEYTPPK